MTTATDPARADLAAWLAEAARREHLHAELLEREMRTLRLAPIYRIQETRREIDATKAVESWLAQQLQQISGGER
jgi:hypothetical protein